MKRIKCHVKVKEKENELQKDLYFLRRCIEQDCLKFEHKFQKYGYVTREEIEKSMRGSIWGSLCRERYVDIDVLREHLDTILHNKPYDGLCSNTNEES